MTYRVRTLICTFTVAVVLSTSQAAIVCEGWCYPSGVCQSTGTQCGCNQSYVVSNCRHRLTPDTGAACSGKCNNGGTCIVHNGLPICVCAGEFYGSLCQYVRQDRCLKGCQNGGTCQTLKTDTMNQTKGVCLCSSHFYGDLCQFNATDCPEPCLNGGVCQNGNCLCTKYFTGSRCHLKTGHCESEAAFFDRRQKHGKQLSPGNIATIVVIAFSTLCLAFGVRFYKKWRIKRYMRRRLQANRNDVPNNRAWLERNSSHPGVNFVQIPDLHLSSVHPPSAVTMTPSTSNSSTTGAQPFSPSSDDVAGMSGVDVVNRDRGADEDVAMATGESEMPPPYESVVNPENSKSSVRYQELSCRYLDQS